MITQVIYMESDIIISFIDFIRKEKKFDGIDSLKKQISVDSIKAD